MMLSFYKLINFYWESLSTDLSRIHVLKDLISLNASVCAEVDLRGAVDGWLLNS